MQRTSKIAENSGFIPAEACGLQDDVNSTLFSVVDDTTTTYDAISFPESALLCPAERATGTVPCR